jgi:peptidoglycan hydrolase-like protein with peptidoglycan-binding domain
VADPGPFKRPLYPPSHPKGPVPNGADVEAVKRAVSRAGFFPWQEFDRAYNEKIADAVVEFQKKNGLGSDSAGAFGEPTFKKLKGKKVPAESPNAGQSVFDERAAELYREYLVPDSVPDLGVVFKGGKTVLSHDLTHRTSGLPPNDTGQYWPAFDDAFSQGVTILAPEDIEITKASSSNPGDACYAKGKSKIQYWFGHLTTAPAVGAKIAKGKKIGVTCVNNQGGGPHVHVAVNVEKLWGTGQFLKHHTNYTHGAPKIGDQLAGH